MRMTADDQVYPQLRIQQLRQSAVLLNSDMSQKDGHIRFPGPVIITNNTDFSGCLFHIDKSTNNLLILCGGQHFPRQNTNEQNLYSIDFDIQIRLKQPRITERYKKIGIDDYTTLSDKQRHDLKVIIDKIFRSYQNYGFYDRFEFKKDKGKKYYAVVLYFEKPNERKIPTK